MQNEKIDIAQILKDIRELRRQIKHSVFKLEEGFSIVDFKIKNMEELRQKVV